MKYDLHANEEPASLVFKALAKSKSTNAMFLLNFISFNKDLNLLQDRQEHIMSATTTLILTNALVAAQKQQACICELDQLLQQAPEVIFANLSLLDGRTYAMSSLDQRDPQRIAALSSTLLALSESFAREVRGGRCSHVTVSMEQGFVVTVRVPTEHGGYILSVFVDNSANLAMALRWALGLVEKLLVVLA